MAASRILLSAVVACSAALLVRSSAPTGPTPANRLPEIKKLPDPFTFRDGSKVRTPEGWRRRRAELKALFEDYQYGHLPPKPGWMSLTRGAPQVDEAAKVTRQALALELEYQGRSLALHVSLTIPTRSSGKVPVVIQGGLGRLPAALLKAKPKFVRGPDRSRVFTERGYAFAELNFQEAAIDDEGQARSVGVYQLFGEKIDCGALMAWAWATSRVIDALDSVDRIDPAKIVVSGHSMYGKAALLAGAFDERIALTVPSHSGCSGAAPHRFTSRAGEPLHDAFRDAPHRYRPDFGQFVGRVDRLPVDQHLLAALVAPRALLATEGTEDAPTNPEGSQLAHQAARHVYEFLGAGDRISIRFRPVGHVQNVEDLLDFADHVFFGKALPAEFGKLAFPEAKGRFDWSAPK